MGRTGKLLGGGELVKNVPPLTHAHIFDSIHAIIFPPAAHRPKHGYRGPKDLTCTYFDAYDYASKYCLL